MLRFNGHSSRSLTLCMPWQALSTSLFDRTSTVNYIAAMHSFILVSSLIPPRHSCEANTNSAGFHSEASWQFAV